MSNPYSPPEADVADAPPDAARGDRPGWLIKLSIWVFFGYGTLQLWIAVLRFLRLRRMFGEEIGGIPYLAGAIGVPLCLFIGGVLLLFQRKAAVAFLLLWLLYAFGRAAYLIDTPDPTVVVVTIVLAMALSLWKRGHLR